MKKILFIAGFILFLSSCGSSKKVAPKVIKDTSSKTIKKEPDVAKDFDDKNLDFATLRYIAKYSDIAKKEMKDFGVPASITMAQGILESQSGKSRLAREGNNHFGIKCHKDWRGEKILHDDNRAQECFRKYINPEESFADHSKFLANRKRYAFLFRLPKTDYEAWAHGLKKAGYATDPSYPTKLIYIINKYKLNKLDKDVLSQMSVKVDESEVHKNNNKKKFIYEVKEGETLFTIARKFNVPVKDIQRINNLNDFDIYQGQILVLTENNGEEDTDVSNEDEVSTNADSFNESEDDVAETNNTSDNTSVSKENAEVGNADEDLELHVVKQGETLFLISKICQVSVDRLRQLNNLKGNEIKVGSVIKVPKKQTESEVEIETPKKEEVVKPVVSEPKPVVKTEEDAVYHVVQPGETLYRIHVNYHVPISKLRKLNHLKGNFIKVGQKIRIK